MKLENKIPNINKHLKEGYEYIEPSKLSQPCLSVPDIVFEYGNVLGKVKTLPFMGHYMVGCMSHAIKSYRHMYDTPNNFKTQISQQDLHDLKTYIKTLEIGDIGFTKVDNSIIFSNKKILYPNAIVLIMEMKKATQQKLVLLLEAKPTTLLWRKRQA